MGGTEGRRVLESWKAIAAYLGRTEKTCRKWEHELGLPIHRLDDSPKAHVFAYADEIDRWKEEKLKTENGREARSPSRLSPNARIWLIAASAVAVLAVIGFLAKTARRGGRASTSQTVKSVAVLPFVDLSPDKDQEHLGDGIADILINALNGIEGLRTPARTSAFYFKGVKATPQEIGRKLKVEWILEGSVQVYENKLRVVASLLSVADGYQLWTERYDRNPADIFAVEDEIARRVVDNLKVKINGDTGAPIVKPGTANLEAYNLYLTGQFYLEKGVFFNKQAIEYFEKALEKDPNYAEPYAGIAIAYHYLGINGLLPPAEASPKARTAALKALGIDSRNPYALSILSAIKFTYDWDFLGAENDIRKAIRDNPRNPLFHGSYAYLLVALARFEEGLAELELAIRLDPLWDKKAGGQGWLYFLARKYDLALERYKEAVELDPHDAGNYVGLVQIYLAMGRYEDARAANQRRREIHGASSQPDDFEPWNAMVYARTGNAARAREILANLKARNRDEYFPYHMYAWIHAALGEKDEAFFWLERAYRERTGQLQALKVHPLADPLRSDPRFADLLRRIGLEK